MGTVGWLLVVAVGVALGFSAGRLWPGTSAKITELERQRDAAREDLNTYREEVGTHFEKTAELFDKVTADYRGLYEHLAIGARQLGAIKGEAVEAPSLAEPEQRRLAAIEPNPVSESDPEEPPAEDSVEATESQQAPDEETPKQPEQKPPESKSPETQVTDEDEVRKPGADEPPSGEAAEARDEEPEASPEDDARRRAAANDETVEESATDVQQPDEATRDEPEPATEDEKVREHSVR